MPIIQDSTGSTACMEHQVLEHIKQALLVTLNWQAPVVSMPRKLSSLQFTIKSFQPFPSFPYNYAPLIDAIWFVIGLGILGVLWYRKKDDWIARAGEATVDADEIKEIDPA